MFLLQALGHLRTSRQAEGQSVVGDRPDALPVGITRHLYLGEDMIDLRILWTPRQPLDDKVGRGYNADVVEWCRCEEEMTPMICGVCGQSLNDCPRHDGN